MPQTVPNSPTKGAVEPTVASSDMPLPRRRCTRSVARWMHRSTKSAKSTLPRRPSCFCVACMPASAMKRNGLPSASRAVPACTVPAFQNSLSTARAWRPMRICSSSLVTITYQLPIDMIARMASTALATASLCDQSAPTP